jgi:hypothetical protein
MGHLYVEIKNDEAESLFIAYKSKFIAWDWHKNVLAEYMDSLIEKFCIIVSHKIYIFLPMPWPAEFNIIKSVKLTIHGICQ